MSRIGELVMEKAHQSLKTAIRHSNNRDVQVISMMSIAISDWQDRLTMVVPDALRGDSAALRCCFRLLAGREALFALDGRLRPEHYAQVMATLGPITCVPYELHTQGCTVLSPRLPNMDLQWKIEEKIEVLSSLTSFSTEERRRTLTCIENAYFSDLENRTVTMGDAVSCTLPNGLPGPRFRRGDVIELLC